MGIAEKEKEIKDAEDTFQKKLKELQENYSKMQKDKDEAIKKVKDSGLSLMKTVVAHKGKKKDEL